MWHALLTCWNVCHLGMAGKGTLLAPSSVLPFAWWRVEAACVPQQLWLDCAGLVGTRAGTGQKEPRGPLMDVRPYHGLWPSGKWFWGTLRDEGNGGNKHNWEAGEGHFQGHSNHLWSFGHLLNIPRCPQLCTAPEWISQVVLDVVLFQIFPSFPSCLIAPWPHQNSADSGVTSTSLFLLCLWLYSCFSFSPRLQAPRGEKPSPPQYLAHINTCWINEGGNYPAPSPRQEAKQRLLNRDHVSGTVHTVFSMPFRNPTPPLGAYCLTDEEIKTHWG